MRLGIDFGTTRIAVAAVDRGNYPVVTFDSLDGDTREWFPPVVAVRGEQRLYGWPGWSAQQEVDWTVVRSLKRFLPEAGPHTLVEIGGQCLPLLQVLREMLSSLKAAILETSSLNPSRYEALEVMLGVPANANSNQRYLTAEAFRQAGFHVLGLLNEPSAASVEFGHRRREKSRTEPEFVLVYDFGGGTFDTSLVEIGERTHTVVASESIPTLGGDDFDAVLAELALDSADLPPGARDSLTQGELFRLHEECRERKESLHPNTRRIAIDLDRVRDGWQQVSVPIQDFYDRCRPLVEETRHAVEDMLAAESFGLEGSRALSALYVTGGGSEMPLVSRVLRESFGRRVRRSAYTRLATAIGLAIQADAETGYRLQDRFLRHFGVWREAEGGSSVVFDPLFEKGSALPGPGEAPVESRRAYIPVHNVGHFRYLECTQMGDGKLPTGDVSVWDEILFPFDPSLKNEDDLTETPVTQNGAASAVIEEVYSCDSGGVVTVTIANRTAGYSRAYRLGRWSASHAKIVPKPRRRTAPHPRAAAAQAEPGV